jgi:hypothetical protein
MKKHVHIGFVEVKTILYEDREFPPPYEVKGQEVYFLMDCDQTLKKVSATYGPFRRISDLIEFASMHSINVVFEL